MEYLIEQDFDTPAQIMTDCEIECLLVRLEAERLHIVNNMYQA